MSNVLTELDINRFKYNGIDCINTFKIARVEEDLISQESEKLQSYFKFKMGEVAPALIDIMNDGVLIDLKRQQELKVKLTSLAEGIVEKINYLMDEEVNVGSVLQLKSILKDLLKVELTVNKKTKTESCSSVYMLDYLKKYPEYKVLLTLILELRSINVFLKTFVSAEVDEDGMMRTSYNVAGTKTERLASKKNAFGRGMNMANIPSKGKIKLKYALQDINSHDDLEELEESVVDGDEELGLTSLPNCKELFIPPEGYSFFNMDLSGADAQIVANESNCKFLLDFFKNSDLKLYQYIGSHYLQREISTDDKWYKIFKQFCHGCLTNKHEVLTQNGWVSIDKFKWRTDKLAVWDKDTNAITFELSKDFYEGQLEEGENIYSIYNKDIIFSGTLNHKFAYKSFNNKIDVKELIDLPNSCKIPSVGNYVGGNLIIEKTLLELCAIVQLVGEFEIDNLIKITTNSDRQYKILTTILSKLNVEYRATSTSIKLVDKNTKEDYLKDIFTFKFYKDDIFKLGLSKPNWDLLNLNLDCLKVFLDSLINWNKTLESEYVTKSLNIVSENIEIINIYKTLFRLIGINTKLKFNHVGEFGNVELLKQDSPYHTMIKTKNSLKTITKKTKIYCPVTSTGFFLTKNSDTIYITGNSHYGMMAEKAGLNAGIPIHEAKKLQKWYFSLCPEIPHWHKQILSEIDTKGYIENIFGARGWFLNKECPTRLNQAIAWLPQSTIAVLINKILVAIVKNEKNSKIKMQIHDAVAGIFPNNLQEKLIPSLKEQSKIILPYKTPLIIDTDFSFSDKSYGGCKS